MVYGTATLVQLKNIGGSCDQDLPFLGALQQWGSPPGSRRVLTLVRNLFPTPHMKNVPT